MPEEPVEPARSQRLWLPPHSRPCARSGSPVSRPSRPWLEPVRFEYRVSEHQLALVCLLADLDAALGPPNAASLLVRHAAARTRYPASAAETMLGRALLWQVSFEVPLDVVESPQALFRLEAPDRVPIAMPAPGLRPDAAGVIARAPTRPFRPLIRRAAAVFATGVAFAAFYGSCAGVAAADSGSPGTTPSSSGASATTTASTVTTGNAGQPPTTTTPTSGNQPSPSPSAPPDHASSGASTTAARSTAPASPVPGPAATTPRQVPGPADAGSALASKPSTLRPLACPPPTTEPVATTSPSSQPQPSPSPKWGGCVQPKKTKRKAKRKARWQRSSLHHRGSSHGRRSRRGRSNLSRSGSPPSGGAAVTPPPVQPGHGTPNPAGVTTPSAAAAAPATPWTKGVAIDPFTAAQIEQFSAVSANLDQPPAFLIPIYKAAGRRYHIPWQILAAINAIETGYGEDLSISPAGAMGWMQFMPGTWARFGVRVAGDSRPNPYDPRDAIFSAARYLAANGGSDDIRRALFAYNHALWYVDAVLWRAQLISDRAIGHAGPSGYALPLDSFYMRQLGRTDDGVDIEDAPDGAAVYSITPGVVTAVASDPSGFGPDYPVILVTAGPLAGQYIYYGHVAASLVRAGQHVLAGQPIAIVGHTGDAAGLGHGHIEIGFSDASGDPLNHHGAIAWTPSGAVMRTVLVALTHRFVSLPIGQSKEK
jgi:hypothetical protein